MEPRAPVEQFADRPSDRERLETVERRLDEVVTMLLRLSEGVQDLTVQSKSSTPLKRRMHSSRNLNHPSTGSRLNSTHGEPSSPVKPRGLSRHMSLMDTKSKEMVDFTPFTSTNFEAKAKAAVFLQRWIKRRKRAQLYERMAAMYRSSGSSVFPFDRQGSSSSSTGSQRRGIFTVSRAISKFKKLRKVAPESPPKDASQSIEQIRSRIQQTVTNEQWEEVNGASQVASKAHSKLVVKRKVPGHFGINPKGRFRMGWDLAIVLPLLVYLAVIMPFRLCFNNEPEFGTPIYWVEFTIDLVFIGDIVLNFFTGVFLTEDEGGKLIEYDRGLIAKRYFRTWFWLDVASGIPFALLELVFVASLGDASTLKIVKALRLVRFLKLGRLLKVEKILSNLDRDTLDKLEDFFQDNATRSVITIFGLALKTFFICHLLSCSWVSVGRTPVDSATGEPQEFNWMYYELGGPYSDADTETGPNVGAIYLSAFYFCFTTMTSVGYGDIVARNNSERLLCVFIELVGGFTFAMIIAALTSVVTSMDTNARKTAEQLDAVASFVANRNFPEALGRRIRRHFRHFYSLKSAIDESKIFSELSTSLRKEVSAYLVSELMGNVGLFQTMSPILWPRLLPLLRPMRFEAEEVVCAQGEDCSEMYVVLSGHLHGATEVSAAVAAKRRRKEREQQQGGGAAEVDLDDDDEGDAYVRRIRAGDTINILCVLGIWGQAVESAVAEVVVETYAITEKDFASLFTAEADLIAFEEMKAHECSAFVMDLDDVAKAPTAYGKPLYLACFSMVEFEVVQAWGLAAADSNGYSDAYAKCELRNRYTGARVLPEMFEHRTSTVNRTRDPVWGEVVTWSDVAAPFDTLSLRVSIYDSDFLSRDTFLGCVDIPFADLESHARGGIDFDPTVAANNSAGIAAGRLSARKSSMRVSANYSADQPTGPGPIDSPRRQRSLANIRPLSKDQAERWYPLHRRPANTSAEHRFKVQESAVSDALNAVGAGAPSNSAARGAQSPGKPYTNEVSEVTGSIKLRTRVRRAERETGGDL